MKETQTTIYECDVCHLRSAIRTTIERCEKHHAKLPFFKKGDRVEVRGVRGSRVSGVTGEVYPNPDGHPSNYNARFVPDTRIDRFQIDKSFLICNVDPRTGVLMNEDELWPEAVP